MRRILEVDDAGLSTDSATERRTRFGPNQLPEAAAPGWWLMVLRQFRSPLIYNLAAAAVVSVLIGR